MKAPPITSEWPPTYLVVECTTTSAPSSSEGVVHDQQAAHLVCEGRNRGDVGNQQERVRGGLDPHDLGALRANHAFGLGQVGQIHRLGGDALGRLDDAQELVRSPVHVGRVHNVVAGARQQTNHRVLSAHARREREPVRRPLQRGQRPRKRVGCRVTTTPVLVSAAQLARPVLHVRRRDVHRRYHVPRHGIRVKPGVDGQRREVGTVSRAHTVTVRGRG